MNENDKKVNNISESSFEYLNENIKPIFTPLIIKAIKENPKSSVSKKIIKTTISFSFYLKI